MKYKKLHVLLMIVFLAIIFNGCSQKKYVYNPPDNFIKIDPESPYNNFISADKTILKIYWIKESAGSLDFWFETVYREIEEQLNYTPLEKGEIKSKNGVDGKYTLFETIYEGEESNYIFFIFRSGKYNTVIEYGAEKEKFNRHLENVKQSVRDVTIM